MMPPIEKANVPSKYYIFTKKRKIKVSTKIARFIVRYILPTIVLSGIIAYTYLYLTGNTLFSSIDKVVFVACAFGLGIIAIIISNVWFTLISKIEDKDEEL